MTTTSSSEVVTSAREVALVDLVDRLLHKGVVLTGQITLSIADIDLVYVELQALIASVDTVRGEQQ